MVQEKKLGFWAAVEFATLPHGEQVARATGISTGAEAEDRKPTIEDAKVAANKGKARARSKLRDQRSVVLQAAFLYGEEMASRAKGAGDRRTKARKALEAAARDLWALREGQR